MKICTFKKRLNATQIPGVHSGTEKGRQWKNVKRSEQSAINSINGEGNGNPLQYSCLGKSHGWRSLVGCRPWGRQESDTTERLHFHFSLSCIGEGNGNPLQYSCLENPRDGGTWWAAVYGVAQGQTRLKQLSSSSNSIIPLLLLSFDECTRIT